jgi:hypothetical protein
MKFFTYKNEKVSYNVNLFLGGCLHFHLFPNAFPPSSLAQLPPNAVTSIVDGLKRLYIEKLKPLEVAYRFNDFGSPLMVSGLNTYFNLFNIRCFCLVSFLS